MPPPPLEPVRDVTAGRLACSRRPRSGGLGLEAVLGCVLESAEIVDLGIAHVFQHLAGKSRAATRSAIKNDRPVLAELLVVRGGVGIGAEFDHAARHMRSPFELAGLGKLGPVADIDKESVLLRHELACFIDADLRDGGISLAHELLYG